MRAIDVWRNCVAVTSAFYRLANTACMRARSGSITAGRWHPACSLIGGRER
jgi:hypothetical protein